jgi:hypothetical protein
MSAEPSGQPGGAGGAGAAGEPGEEELRAAYEAELSRITATDMMAQAAVSLLNIGARRLGPPPEAQGQDAGAGPGAVQRDLEQVRDAIDGARALLEILERRIPRELGPLRDALSRLQMAYAREVQTAPGAAQEPAGPPAAPAPGSPAQQQPGAGDQEQGAEQPGGRKGEGPGPAEASGRLWVPGR